MFMHSKKVRFKLKSQSFNYFETHHFFSNPMEFDCHQISGMKSLGKLHRNKINNTNHLLSNKIIKHYISSCLYGH